MRRALLMVAGGAVVAVIGLQAQRLSQAEDRADLLERQRDAAEARAKVALTLSERVAAELEALPGPEGAPVPAELLRARAARLAQEARILREGDPQLLDPSAADRLLPFFDELL